MGKRALQTFMDAVELRGIGAASLSRLLGKYAEFFKERGITLGGDDDAFPFEDLADVLQRDRLVMPQDLADALWLITEMADASSLEALNDIARRESLLRDEDEGLTAADLAVRIYLHDAAILREKRNQRRTKRQRSFIFLSAGRPCPQSPFTMEAGMRKHFEAACRDEFMKRQHGRGVQLRAYPEDDIVRFMVLHGEGITRMGVMQDGATSSVLLRPAKYDVFHFDPHRGILGMPKNSPLWMVRAVGGIRLERLDWERAGENGGPWSAAASDVFAAFAEQDVPFPTSGLIKARFMIEMASGDEERYFEIQGERCILCQRDTDLELLWPWLSVQEFLPQVMDVQPAAEEELADVTS